MGTHISQALYLIIKFCLITTFQKNVIFSELTVKTSKV